ncbi:MAG: NGG1p interacting factor NIF3 [Natronospirillum sp.]|uniref:NGG1p interacting factor NIF3 n=1 Tax=Natronospirillum sp. TaxID=2812955 RepID=UPI0025FD2763|nr:NGG1p interacting factor NIF3 [Natronospirillum sp.]MCH8553182.1 NGG1p interacting factor NIF3 [Natronospirillum sp.]
MAAQYKLIWFVPDSHVEQTKAAVFEAGAGRQGDYEWCAWQCHGTGQFRPGAAANPYLGKPGELEQVAEYRVETLVDEAHMSTVLKALRASHPYEEPAFEIVQLVSSEAWA